MKILFDILIELDRLMEENNIPCQITGTDPKRLYYPARSGYVFSVKAWGDASHISLFTTGGDWVNDYTDAQEVYNLIAEKHFHKKVATDFIAEEIARLKAFDAGCPSLSEHARNLNLMALEGKLFRAYGRETETEQIMRIMLRKTKPNTLLIGKAGCGKTAIVENLAHYIVDGHIAYMRALEDNKRAKLNGEPCEVVCAPLFNDTIIYDLDISALCAGTKYRGEFEEKVRNIVRETQKNPNIVLFIDEIHQINSLGNAEGASGMGQLLKPALARGDIHCIGATTDKEAEMVYADAALARRFNKVRVLPLGGEIAVNACAKILADYSKSHGIEVEDADPAHLFEIAQTQLKATSFPDNFINLVDETMAGAKFERQTKVTKADFEATVKRLLGSEVISVRLGFGM